MKLKQIIAKILKYQLFRRTSFVKAVFLKFTIAFYKIIFFNRKKSVRDIFDFAMRNFNDPIPLWQKKDEFCDFLSLLQERKPKYVLEIGTAGGGSLFMLSQVVPDDAVLISVDLPFGNFGGGYPKIRSWIYKSFARANQKLFLINGDSHSSEVLEKINYLLNMNKLDLIFIDGDHSYSGVKTDFELYLRLIKKNGIVAFHDIVYGPEEYVGGVPKYWSEIKSKYKTIEFIEDSQQIGFGIGVIML